MPKFIRGNLWESDADIIAISANGTFRDNKLIMGAGAAMEMRRKYPDIDIAFYFNLGLHPDLFHLIRTDDFHTYYLYGFDTVSFGKEGKRLGFFQSKIDYRKPSNLALIGYSVMSLLVFFTYNYNVTVAMNFPGVGYGGLSKEAVRPLLLPLPDSVSVYSLD